MAGSGSVSSDGRFFSFGECRRVARFLAHGVVVGLGTVAAASALVATVTVAAAWIVNTALATHPSLNAKAPIGPAAIALAGHDLMLAGAFPGKVNTGFPKGNATTLESRALSGYEPSELIVNLNGKRSGAADFTGSIGVATEPADSLTFEAKWARATAYASPPMDAVPLGPEHPVERAGNVASLPPVGQAAQPVAPAASEKRVAPQQAHNKSMLLPDPESRTAVYDIAAHTVYMPNGARLEAHSGLGNKLDDPRYVSFKDRGPTPPNVYDLALREQLFHNVRAIRLNPVGGDSMFGRDGMLAHTYMLGANGQSNGCVSFKDYPAFLHAYLRGEVDRLVVVPHLENATWRTASARREPARRYADNNP